MENSHWNLNRDDLGVELRDHVQRIRYHQDFEPRGAVQMSDCLHESNPNGGFERSHRRFCGYGPTCFEDATVHVRTDGWCGNTCKACGERIAKTHRVIVSKELRGISEENANV